MPWCSRIISNFHLVTMNGRTDRWTDSKVGQNCISTDLNELTTTSLERFPVLNDRYATPSPSHPRKWSCHGDCLFSVNNLYPSFLPESLSYASFNQFKPNGIPLSYQLPVHFRFKGGLVVIFNFYSNLNRLFYKQTVEALIRCCVM